MNHAWYSNQLERLAERLIDNLRRDPPAFPASLFEKTRLVVHNPYVATYLTFEIARTRGIAANLEFQLLNQFLAGLVESSWPNLRLLDLPKLQNLLLGLFNDEEGLREPVLAPIRAYLEAAGEDARDLRRFQLAGHLALLFERYGYARVEMLRAWSDGQDTLADTEYAATESWQRALWSHLFRRDGRLDEIHRQTGLRHITLADLPELFGEEAFHPPRQAHLFGFSYVGRVYQQVFAALAHRMDLHLYTFVPAAEFWEDLKSVGDQKRWSRRFPKQHRNGHATTMWQEPDPFRLDDPSETPALRLWGRPGREYLRLLSELPQTVLHPEFVSRPQTAATLLGQLQHDILVRSPAVPPVTESRFSDDSSLVNLACPGIQREVEVIANEIWSLIKEDEAKNAAGASGDRLRFNDIAIVVANSQEKDVYQTHIRSAFSDLYEIPFNLIDVTAVRESRVVEAVDLLLALPLGGFTRPELLGLLTHPALLACFPDADRDEWQTWCEELSIFHGADHQDHDGQYIEKDLINWDQGMRRLVLGAFMSGSRSGDERAFPLGGRPYLPQEYPDGSLANAARLVVLVRSLVADARFARQAQLPLREWAAFLGRLVTTYLGAESDADQRSLSRCLREIYRLGELDMDGQAVPYPIAREFVHEALARLPGSRGQYLADGVVVSSSLPMRALPFRVVFVCGLGEGHFPARDQADPLDLTCARRIAGDVTSRERDKYLFLETLVATRDRLYLTYIARDSQTGEELEPSPLIQELRYILRRGYLDEEGVQRLVRRHPLRRYDEQYFPRPGTDARAVYCNYSPAALREASACYLRDHLQAQLPPGRRPLKPEEVRNFRGKLADWLGLCPLPGRTAQSEGVETVSVSLAALRGFLECPLQGWARHQLGMREEVYEDLVARADENFSMPYLHRVVFLRDVFLEAIARVGPSELPPFEEVYDARAAHLELRGTMPTGLFHGAERARHFKTLRVWHSNLQALGLAERLPLQVFRFGRADEYLKVDQLHQPVLLDLDLPGPARKVRVELHGKTEAVTGDLSASVTLVVRDNPSKKDFLRGFLDYVFLTLVGSLEAERYQAVVLPGTALSFSKGKTVRSGRDGRWPFAPLSRERAAAYLRQVLAEMLAGPHPYLLPCEAVFDFRAPGNEKSLEEIVHGLKDNPYASYSSLYGPVPDPARYEPPAREQAAAIIERRFGLFFQEPEGADEDPR
jgi:exodeoxyribonuclease V gamma subunit